MVPFSSVKLRLLLSLLLQLSLAAAEPLLMKRRPPTESKDSPWGREDSGLVAITLPSFQRPPDLADQLFLKDRIIVKMKQQGGKGGSQLKVVRLKAGVDVGAAIEAYSNRTDVEYAAYDDLMFPDVVPNDPQVKEQWALQRVGAPNVWNLTTGSSNVTVCVIDTGIDYTHPDLAGNMHPSLGYSTFTQTNDPMDELRHGTHAAGIVGAVGNNGVNVAGVNWQVKLLACKFIDAKKYGSTSDGIACINYCTAQEGVRIISTSWGGAKNYNWALDEAIREAGKKDILFVSSAGNSALNLSEANHYPASFGSKLDNMLVVASSGMDSRDPLSQFSNYSPSVVHLAAPGEGIVSTVPGGGTVSFSGTSMAAPFVTGAAALLLSASNGTLTTPELRQIILDSVQPVPLLVGKVASGGRLSIDSALRLYLEKYVSSSR